MNKLLTVTQLLLTILSLFVFTTTIISAADTTYSAHCLLQGTSFAPGLKGVVTFTKNEQNQTVVNWQIDQSTVPSSLQNKTLGFHVHQFGYIANPDGTSTGSHFNPNSTRHALPSEGDPMHAGDLGNIDLSLGYSGSIISHILEFNGNYSMIGRAVRLHMSNDKGSAFQPAGSAGDPAATCVIGISSVVSGVNNAAMQESYTGTYLAAVLQPTVISKANITGRVLFQRLDNGSVRVFGKICGVLPNTVHGFHVHQFGQLNLTSGLDFGSHFNPTGVPHGLPYAERHMGDMGNLTSDANGMIVFDNTFDLLQFSGVNSIIGRGLVLHNDTDDGSQPVGNAGNRIAIAVIGIPDAAPTLTTPVDACTSIAPQPVVPQPQVSPKVSPGVSPKPSPKTSPQASPKASPKVSTKTSPKTSPKKSVAPSIEYFVSLVITLVSLVMLFRL
ncbi:hypothetical protein ABK040_003497 [Willaertia magna]